MRITGLEINIVVNFVKREIASCKRMRFLHCIVGAEFSQSDSAADTGNALNWDTANSK